MGCFRIALIFSRVPLFLSGSALFRHKFQIFQAILFSGAVQSMGVPSPHLRTGDPEVCSLEFFERKQIIRTRLPFGSSGSDYFSFWCRWRGSNPHAIADNGF